MSRLQGPNVKNLAIHKMSIDAVPSDGGFKHGLAFLMDKDRIINSARASMKWVFEAIDLVRSAPGGELLGDDEAIAGEILKKIEERRALHKS